MSKLSIVTVTSLLAFTSAAVAADLPSRLSAPPMLAAAPMFTWTGFYAGVNVGAAFSNMDRRNSFFFPLNSIAGSEGTNGTLTTRDGNKDDTSFTGGGQIGYNYQFGGSNIVVGIEADAQYLGFGNGNRGANSDYNFAPLSPFGVPAAGLAFTSPTATVARNGVRSIDYFGTVRGRVGYAFGRALVYGTGGFAYGGGDTDFGYAAGGGLEYAITDRISAKVEGLYVNLDNKSSSSASYNVTTNVLTLSDARRSTDFGVARVGVNYRF